MHGTLLARTFFISERTTVKACMGILKQFFTLRTKSNILLFLPAVKTYHKFDSLLFARYTWLIIFIHISDTIGKDSKQIANSEKNFRGNDVVAGNYRYLCAMKKLLCPQCKIAAMYVKNDSGERLLVYVLDSGEVVPKYPEESMEGFDLTEVYCLGCSWHGSPKRLVQR